jgi:hypothetical protein
MMTNDLLQIRVSVSSVHVWIELRRIEQARMSLVERSNADHLHCGLKLVLDDFTR